MEKPGSWHIGLGPWAEQEAKPELGLTLSIVGSPTTVRPREEVDLQAVLKNEFHEKSIHLGSDMDVILTFHFRYRGGHRDKQELYRCRVQLPDRKLHPGQSVDLTEVRGWKRPVNGHLGDPFHLRIDTGQWRRGCRLRATARLVRRREETSQALENLQELIRSKEVLPIALQTQ